MVRAGDRGVCQFGCEPDVVAVEAESIEGGGIGRARLALGYDRESEAAVEHERIRERPDRGIEQGAVDGLGRDELGACPPARIEREGRVGGTASSAKRLCSERRYRNLEYPVGTSEPVTCARYDRKRHRRFPGNALAESQERSRGRVGHRWC